MLAEEFDLTKNKINGIIYSMEQKEENNFIDFGFPGVKQKIILRKIQNDFPELFEKIKGKISFTKDNDINIQLDNGRNIKMPIQQPLINSEIEFDSIEKSFKEHNIILPIKEEFELLFSLFTINGRYNKILIELLGSNASRSFSYFSSTLVQEKKNHIYIADFSKGVVIERFINNYGKAIGFYK